MTESFEIPQKLFGNKKGTTFFGGLAKFCENFERVWRNFDFVYPATLFQNRRACGRAGADVHPHPRARRDRGRLRGARLTQGKGAVVQGRQAHDARAGMRERNGVVLVVVARKKIE